MPGRTPTEGPPETVSTRPDPGPTAPRAWSPEAVGAHDRGRRLGVPRPPRRAPDGEAGVALAAPEAAGGVNPNAGPVGPFDQLHLPLVLVVPTGLEVDLRVPGRVRVDPEVARRE